MYNVHKADYTICPLYNFELKDDTRQEFQILDIVKLRRIKVDELENLKKHPLHYLLGGSFSLINSKTFVFELKTDNTQLEDRLVYQVLLAMRLFKTGSVCCKHFLHLENSNLIYAFTINTPIPRSIKDKYLLNIDEIDEIKNLLEKIVQINLGKNKPFRVACERFSRSFEERRDDDKIIDLAIAFEALFTDKNTSRTNVMGQLIGLGCAMLLGTSQNEINFIKSFFEKAFNIRNKIIHGSEIKSPIIVNEQKYKMNELSSQMREYLRKSIRKLI